MWIVFSINPRTSYGSRPSALISYVTANITPIFAFLANHYKYLTPIYAFRTHST